MRNAVVVGIGEQSARQLEEIHKKLGEKAETSHHLRSLLLLPHDSGITAIPDQKLVLPLSHEDLLSFYYRSHVRAWCAANWQTWGGALLETRLYGKFAGLRNMEEILKQIERLEQDLSRKSNKGVDVYVHLHLDDPFASGMFLDLAYLLDGYASSHKRETYPIRVIGIGILPSASASDERQATAYAALRELAFSQGAFSFYPNPLDVGKGTPYPGMTHDRRPFTTGGFYVIGGDKREKGTQLTEDEIRVQVSAWVWLCSFTERAGEFIVNRVQESAQAFVSTFGVSDIPYVVAEPEQDDVLSRTRRQKLEGQIRHCLWHTLESGNADITPAEREALRDLIRLPVLEGEGFHKALIMDRVDNLKVAPFAILDTAYRKETQMLIALDDDQRTVADRHLEQITQDLWSRLAPLAKDKREFTLEELLKEGGGSVAQRAEQLKTLMGAAKTLRDQTQQQFEVAQLDAETRAAVMKKARAAVAYNGYSLERRDIAQGGANYKSNSTTNFAALIVLTVLVVLLFSTFFFAAGIEPQALVMGIAAVVLVFAVRLHMVRSELLARHAWRKSLEDMLEAQRHLIVARIHHEAAEKIAALIQQATTITINDQPEDRAQRIVQTLEAIFKDVQNESDPSYEIKWGETLVSVWRTILSESTQDVNATRYAIKHSLRDVLYPQDQTQQQPDVLLRRDTTAAAQLASCALLINNWRAEIQGIPEVNVVVLEPEDYQDIAQSSQNQAHIDIERDQRTERISAFAELSFPALNMRRMFVRVLPYLEFPLIALISTYKRAYLDVARGTDAYGRAEVVNRTSLHPTRAGLCSPDPALKISETASGWPYYVECALVVLLLRYTEDTGLWREWAEALRVNVQTKRLHRISFDEICAALQEAPEAYKQLIESLRLRIDSRVRITKRLIEPLVSEAHADWEIWAYQKLVRLYTPHISDLKGLDQTRRAWLDDMLDIFGIQLAVTPDTLMGTTLAAMPSAKAVSFEDDNQYTAESEGIQPLKIGIWGTEHSGKTMYLLMLIKTFIKKWQQWDFAPLTVSAEQFFNENIALLQTELLFPEKTVKTSRYRYLITRKLGKNGTPPQKFVLEMIDTAGELYTEFYHQDKRTTPIAIVQHRTQRLWSEQSPQQIFDVALSQSDGLILLLDEGWGGDGGLSYSLLLTTLFQQIRHARGGMLQPEAMPYIALCLAKADAKEAWWQGKENHPSERGCQRLNGNGCATCRIHHLLGSSFMRDELAHFFPADHVRCFIVSAVGRQKDGSRNVSTQHNWQRMPSPLHAVSERVQPHYADLVMHLNAAKAGQLPLPTHSADEPSLLPTMILNYDQLEPYNLEKPIEWLHDSLQKSATDSPQTLPHTDSDAM